MIEEKRKTTKKLTPPREGLDSLLQRITTSLLFLIPNDFEKRSNTSLQVIESKNPPKQKPNNSNILCSTYVSFKF